MPQLYLLAVAVNVWVLVLILSAGLAVQLIAGELPCPLCVMQRIALMLCALGPLHILMSARDGALTCKAAAVGNGIAIVSALVGVVDDQSQAWATSSLRFRLAHPPSATCAAVRSFTMATRNRHKPRE